MTPLEFLESNGRFLVFLALLVYIALNWSSDQRLQNIDLISAIKRARTSSCKLELHHVAKHSIPPKTLQRSCPLDSEIKPRIYKLGCISRHTQQLIKLDNRVQDPSTCHNLCFSYGHGLGSFDGWSNFCYCGDKGEKFNVITCDNSDQLELFKVNNGIHYVNQTHHSSDSDSHLDSIRIAFLIILSGQNILQVERLIENIYSETHIYYLHVDERHDKLLHGLHNALKGKRNVIFANSRYRTIWGGTSLLPMTIDAISQMSKHKWDFLINLSESDFPIKPLSSLESYLNDHSKSSIYLKSHNIKGYRFIKKQGLDRNFYQCEDRVWRIGNRQLPFGVIYSGGSDWYALPRQFCFYILEDLNDPTSLVNGLIQIFNFTLLPMESFFHTLAHNSKFCDKVVDNNLRITNWNRKQGCKCQHKDIVDWCGCSPLVYRSSDWDKLLQTNQSGDLFFSRKFDPTISSSIINLVEQRLVRRLDNYGYKNSYGSTRYWQNLYRFDDSKNVQHTYEVLDQFGMFCLNQSKSPSYPRLNLISVDLFFNFDRFVGYIFYYCSEVDHCMKFLVVRNTAHRPDNYVKNQCFEFDGRSLRAIEVNHGFDVGERMFRDYQPLHHLSNVVVYHDWLVGLKQTNNNIDQSNQLIFSWINPDGHLRLSQSVKFKNVSMPTRLSLAHRLNISKPLAAGVWSLRISQQSLVCMEYTFLLLDSNSFVQKKITQDDFDKFYSVKSVIRGNKTSRFWSVMGMCSHQDWNFCDNDTREMQHAKAMSML